MSEWEILSDRENERVRGWVSEWDVRWTWGWVCIHVHMDMHKCVLLCTHPLVIYSTILWQIHSLNDVKPGQDIWHISVKYLQSSPNCVHTKDLRASDCLLADWRFFSSSAPLVLLVSAVTLERLRSVQTPISVFWAVFSLLVVLLILTQTMMRSMKFSFINWSMNHWIRLDFLKTIIIMERIANIAAVCFTCLKKMVRRNTGKSIWSLPCCYTITKYHQKKIIKTYICGDDNQKHSPYTAIHQHKWKSEAGCSRTEKKGTIYVTTPGQ